MNPALRPDELPSYYRSVSVHAHDRQISPEIELSRWLADEERKRNKRPVTLFRNIEGHPGAAILGNPCPLPVLLAAMGIEPTGWLPALGERLTKPAEPTRSEHGQWDELAGLHELPVPWHRPGDAGRYITAGVTITHSLAGDLNLGVYRIQIVGLTLMSLQNDYLMYAHLRSAGFPVERVSYPHAARGEFLAVIRSPAPDPALLHAAMQFDQRAKVVVCGEDPDDIWQTVASHGFSAATEVYYRKGAEYGDRIGLLFDRSPEGRPVEF